MGGGFQSDWARQLGGACGSAGSCGRRPGQRPCLAEWGIALVCYWLGALGGRDGRLPSHVHQGQVRCSDRGLPKRPDGRSPTQACDERIGDTSKQRRFRLRRAFFRSTSTSAFTYIPHRWRGSVRGLHGGRVAARWRRYSAPGYQQCSRVGRHYACAWEATLSMLCRMDVGAHSKPLSMLPHWTHALLAFVLCALHARLSPATDACRYSPEKSMPSKIIGPRSPSSGIQSRRWIR